MKVSEIIKAMSPEARAAFEALPNANTGTAVPGTLAGEPLRTELFLSLDVVGLRGGLTVKGSAVAQKLQEARLDRMFG